jgi:mono/diheme cytochrome c family protein
MRFIHPTLQKMKPSPVKSSVTRSAVVTCTCICLLLPAAGRAADAAARPVNPYSGDPAVAKEGGSLFNQYCAHCHGQWAEQGERPRDLRRLRIRYGDDAIVMFYTTVNNGRMDKGMPVWKGVLNDDTLWKIFTFLETVQEQD